MSEVDAGTTASRAPEPRWGLGEAALGLVVANLAALVAGVVILAAAGYAGEGTEDLPLGLIAVLQVPLWAGYLGVPVWAARTKGSGPVADFGLAQRWRDVPGGLLAGVVTQVVAIPLLYLPILRFLGERDLSAEARQLTEKATDVLGVALLVLVVAVLAPVIEELFFRGLLLRSIERRFRPAVALWASSLLFGLVHFQLLQLPALVLFGLVAGWLTQRTGRLGPAIWAHVAFNGVAVASLLATSMGEQLDKAGLPV